MWELVGSVLVALITGGFAYLGVVTQSKKQHDITMSAMETKLALFEQKMDTLEKKQDKHNCLIERMYAVEKTVEVLDERQKVANHRLDDLEKAGN